jgi:hypothetical protein
MHGALLVQAAFVIVQQAVDVVPAVVTSYVLSALHEIEFPPHFVVSASQQSLDEHA